MFEQFDNVKKQLSELAGVINSFKSEAVQLRLVELIFAQGSFEEDEHRQDEGGEKVRTQDSTPTEAYSRQRRGK